MSDREFVYCRQCREKHEEPECGMPPDPSVCKHNVPLGLACGWCINDRAAVNRVQMRLDL